MSAPSITAPTTGIEPWWGSHEVPLGTARQWRIGPLTLIVERRRGEWRIGTEHNDDPMDAAVEVGLPSEGTGALEGPAVQRIAFAEDDEVVSLLPRLTTLPVVSRPEIPLSLPSGELTTLYVGSPLDLILSAGERLLTELPIGVRKRTWFGSPEQGELAYASRAFCRMNLDELRHRPHRATTAVTLRNDGADALPLKRILLPTPHLSVSIGSDRHLWTEDVRLTRNDADPLAQLELQSKAWKHDRPGGSVLANARVPESSSTLARVFSPLLPG